MRSADDPGQLARRSRRLVLGAGGRAAADLARVIAEESAAILHDLDALLRVEPLVCLEGAVALLEAVVTVGALRRADEDSATLVADLDQAAGATMDLVSRLFLRDAAASSHGIDREDTFEQLFDIRSRDVSGVFRDFEKRVLGLVANAADARSVIVLARDALADLPLVFPDPLRRRTDVRRAALVESRRRFEWLVGEILARGGDSEYAILAARGHHRETGDPSELVTALIRAGHHDEAKRLAPSTGTRKAEPDPEVHRRLLKRSETAFLRAPSLAAFARLREAVPADQWPRIRRRVLGHLQKHQREPDLVFELYLREGLMLDADGMVVTQPVDPDHLLEAAESVARLVPEMAAGWLIVAAFRLADVRPSRAEEIGSWIAAARRLIPEAARATDFARTLRRFRSRHADSPTLLAAVDRALDL